MPYEHICAPGATRASVHLIPDLNLAEMPGGRAPSLLAMAAGTRMLAAFGLSLGLWLAVAWALDWIG